MFDSTGAVRAVLVAAWVLLSGTGGTFAGEPVWIDKDEDESYTARHECSFVQAGNAFYLFGGRESAQTLDTYDFAADSWSTSATAPVEFNHFQATAYQGLVWVIGAFDTNNFPNENPADAVFVFDPARDVWMEGPSIPVARRRGSAGLVVHEDKFYVVAGNTIGHNGGYVNWFDEYDPQSGSWTPLADAPGARDHFHAAVVGDELYAVGGRLSGGDGGTFAPLIAEVDVFDFVSGTWTRLGASSEIPTPRAASAVAFFNGEILVIGGEGNGQAYDTVEGFDPLTASWTTRASLNFARHGTQAIVSGQGVYVIAGSPQQGGGRQKNMEVYDTDAPSGVALTPGVLDAPAGVTVSTAAPATVALSHVSGNAGAFVTDVALSGPDADDFTITTDVSAPFLIRIGDGRDLVVAYAGSVDGASASLDVSYGGTETFGVALTGTTQLVAPGAASSLTVDKTGSDLTLAWGADCGAGDTYGVYRGNLAAGYGSLEAEVCDVAGTAAIVPAGTPDGEFFLVVPALAGSEGSYGRTSSGERPAASVACHTQGLTDGCVTAAGGDGSRTEVVLRGASLVERSVEPVRANRFAAETFLFKVAPGSRPMTLTEFRAVMVDDDPTGETIEWGRYDFEFRLYGSVAKARAALRGDAVPRAAYRTHGPSRPPQPWGWIEGSYGVAEGREVVIDLSAAGLVVPARPGPHPVLALSVTAVGPGGHHRPAIVESRRDGPTDYLFDRDEGWRLTALDPDNGGSGRLEVVIRGVR